MPIITLITDFGLKDHFVGTLKGKIYSQNLEVRIVDISHNISPFNTIEAAYIIGASYNSFPLGTIHLIGVDCELNKETQQVAALWNGHYFICADNGILSMLFLNQTPDKIVLIDQDKFSASSQNDLNTLTNVTCFLANGGLISDVGKTFASIRVVSDLQPSVARDQKSIIGNVIYIDHLGNAVTNISRQLFKKVHKNRTFEIPMSALLHEKKSIPISRIFQRYSEVADGGKFHVLQYSGSKLAVFNEAGLLEISIFRSGPNVGSAKTLLGMNYRDVVTINFNDYDS